MSSGVVIDNFSGRRDTDNGEKYEAPENLGDTITKLKESLMKDPIPGKYLHKMTLYHQAQTKGSQI